jgi:hypothetical protein
LVSSGVRYYDVYLTLGIGLAVGFAGFSIGNRVENILAVSL